ncbi:hypothetical protein HNQ00_002664 [Flavobacterium sp. 14A]|nr:hypothetical protein [Flavobacterium sp. 14A]
MFSKVVLGFRISLLILTLVTSFINSFVKLNK